MSELAFLQGGGEMGAQMRAHDWSLSPLGAPAGWPQSLRSVVGLMIQSRYPMFVAWGPELAFLYNDGYAPIFGAKHPRMLGVPFREAWSEIWDDLTPLIDSAMAGEATYDEGLHLIMERNGYPEDTWYDFSYSPLRDESDAIVGIFCACTETTKQVLAESAMADRDARLTAVFDQMSEGVIMADAEGKLTFVNRCAEQLHGVANLMVPPEQYSDTFHLFTTNGQPYPFEELPLARAVLKRETVDDARWRIRRPNGSEILAIGSARPVLDGSSIQIGSVLTIRDDTERFKAETALRESEERLRLVIDAATDYAIFTTDPRRVVSSWSRGAELAFGYGADEMIGHCADILWTPEDRAKGAPEGEAEGAETTGCANDERWHLRKDGSRVFMNGSVHPLPPNADGSKRGLIKIARDETEQRAADATLMESEARFRNMADHAPVMMWVTDSDGSCTYLNRSWYEFTGQAEEEALGFGWLKAVHPDDAVEAERAFVEANASSANFRIEYRLRRADGVYRWAIDAASPRFGTEGQFLGFVGSVIDIDDRREAEDAIRERELHLAAIVGQTAAGIAETDLTGRLISVNDRYCALVGRSRDDLLGLTMQDITHPDDLARNVTEFAQMIETGQPFDIEKRYLRPDGSNIWVNNNVSLIQSGELRPDSVLAVSIDISGRKAAENALSSLNETLELRVKEEIAQRTEAEEALRQSQKMETLGQLTGGIAHDFNNLLQIITGNIDILRRTMTEDSPRLQRSVANAMKGAERASVLTQRLLAFSRRQPLAPKVIDPNKLVAGMSEMLHRTIGETVAIETVRASGLWRVEADPNQLENALLNLAVNSRDAMADGGKLTVETANTHLDHDYSDRNSGVSAGQYVVICVSDTGVGMDASTAERAFDPFFTTKEVGKGTGLGLSMVYGFVKQSGGHLKIYSEPDEGTTVKIFLPRHHGEEEISVEDPTNDQLPEGAETILVCEDDDDVRAYSVDSLRELGYRVIEAVDGETALRLLESEGGKVDLLFTDIVLPGGMTGAVVAKQACKAQPVLKVLFTTGYARNAIVHHGRLDPGVELLSKPFAYADLAARIRDLLDAG